MQKFIWLNTHAKIVMNYDTKVTELNYHEKYKKVNSCKNIDKYGLDPKNSNG